MSTKPWQPPPGPKPYDLAEDWKGKVLGPKAAAGPPRKGWPLTVHCLDRKPCRTDDGEPGYDCGDGKCFNPCPVGMAPNHDEGGHYCERICRADTDCREGPCLKNLCTRPHLPCEWGSSEMCEGKGGRWGQRCTADGPCYPTCKKGLQLTGGTHCTKPCSSNANCPGGECLKESGTVGYCIPMCPTGGCPYPWD